MEKMQLLHAAAPVSVFSKRDGIVLTLGPRRITTNWPSYLIATLWNEGELPAAAEVLASQQPLRVGLSKSDLEVEPPAAQATLCASPGPLEFLLASLNGRLRVEPQPAERGSAFDIKLIRPGSTETLAASVSESCLWLECSQPRKRSFLMRFFLNPAAAPENARGRGSRSARSELRPAKRSA
jgi:hypothetical protein